MSSAFASENSNYLIVSVFAQVACLFLASPATFNHAVGMVLATGMAAFYGGNLDLLRTFYVLTAVLIPTDLLQMIFGSLGGGQIFLIILALVARVASVWFGHQVHQEHDGSAITGGAQYDDADVFIPEDSDAA